MVDERPFFYRLVDGEPVAVASPSDPRYQEWLATPGSRVIEHTVLEDPRGGPSIAVLTDFLSLDHQYGEGPPVLWETWVVNGPFHDLIERYTSRDAAVSGHARLVAQLKALLIVDSKAARP